MVSWSGRGNAASIMKIRSKPIKLAWLYVPFMLLLPNIGCISIQNASPARLPGVANCNGTRTDLADLGDDCPLNDRREFLPHWASNCRYCSSMWISNQWGRCEAAKASLYCWIHAKKEAVITPPWPRFHPVPTKPVFEPDEKKPSMTPEIYGRFGKG